MAPLLPLLTAAAFTAGAAVLWVVLLRTRVDRYLGGRSWFLLVGSCTAFAAASLRGLVPDPLLVEVVGPALATAGAVGFLAGMEGLLRDAKRKFHPAGAGP